MSALLGGGGSSSGGSSSSAGSSSAGSSSVYTSGSQHAQDTGSNDMLSALFGDSYGSSGSSYDQYTAPGFGTHSGYGYTQGGYSTGSSYSSTGSSYGSSSGSSNTGGGYGSMLEALLGGGTGYSSQPDSGSYSSGYGSISDTYETDSISGSGAGINLSSLADLFGSGMSSSAAGMVTGWNDGKDNRGRLDTTVASGSRKKFTKVKGNGSDQVTIMIYMCGTDLESRSGMATSDLSEMAAANLSDNVNILVYTGGCARWKNNIVSSKTCQIYRVVSGGLERLVEDDGDRTMTDPATLSRFIRWCGKNFPANRNELIFWDHGCGSLTGYGYDEKHGRGGSMELNEIRDAVKASGIKFDFIGFDACLMATVENAMALSDHADYLLASEETEPGTGWYYTNWLTELSKDPGMPTLEVCRRIVDDFIDVSASKARGQSTTLSLVDLAELQHTFPEAFAAFSKATSSLIKNKQFKTVSAARSSAREFASSNRIDQVDLTDMAWKIGGEESEALVQVLLSAVKYNRTSSNMCNSYGLSVYFPGSRSSKVDTMVGLNKELGMDTDFTQCIQQYATMQTAGVSTSGGTTNVFDMLSGSGGYSGYGSSSGSFDVSSLFGSGSSSGYGSSSSGVGTDLLMELVGSMLGGRMANVEGLDRSNTAFISESGLTKEEIVSTLEADRFDTDVLAWQDNGEYHTLHLTDEQWDQVASLTLNMLYDDGEGYIDLGHDNVFSYTQAGDLIGETDRTWISINGQPVAYYHMGTTQEDGTTTTLGRVPCLLNGERADLLVVFDAQNPYGYIAGARRDYKENETQTVAKSITALEEGDTIDFLCDYYTYDGRYSDSYYLGEQMVVEGTPLISNTDVGDGGALVSYCFTDLYGQQYWTDVLHE